MTASDDPKQVAEVGHLAAAAEKYRAEAEKLRVEIAHLKRTNHVVWFLAKLVIAILVIVPGAWFYYDKIFLPLSTQQLQAEQLRAKQDQLDATRVQLESRTKDAERMRQDADRSRERALEDERLSALRRDVEREEAANTAVAEALAAREAALAERDRSAIANEARIAAREAQAGKREGEAAARIDELQTKASELERTIGELRGKESQLLSRAEAADAVRRIAYDTQDAAIRANTATSRAPTKEAVDAVRKAALAAVPQQLLSEHEAWVLAAAFSPDGKRLATASRDGTTVLWDGDTYQAITRVKNDDAVVHVEFDPSGTFFVTASWDGDVHICSAQDGSRLRRYKGHRGQKVARSRFDAAGARVCSCDHGGGVHVWEVATGNPIAVFHRGAGPTADAAFFNGDDEVVAGGADGDGGNVVRWNIAAHRQVGLADRYPGWVTKLVVCAAKDAYGAVGGGIARAALVAPDGSVRVQQWDDPAISSICLTASQPRSRVSDRAIATYADGRTLIFSLTPTEAHVVAAMAGHTGGVLDVCLSGCGRYAFTASSDRTARIWYLTADEGGDLGVETGTLGGHIGAISALAFHEATRRLVTCGDDRTARVYALAPVLEPRADLVRRATQPRQ